MDKLNFTAGIFLFAFLAFQFGLIYFVLDAKIEPVKNKQAKIEIRLDKLEIGQAKLSEDIAELKQLFYEFKNHSHDQSKQAQKK